MEMCSQLSSANVVLELLAGLCQLRYQCGDPVSNQSEYVLRSVLRGRDWERGGEAGEVCRLFCERSLEESLSALAEHYREDLNI